MMYQIMKNAVSNQGLHGVPFIQQFLGTSEGSNGDISNFRQL